MALVVKEFKWTREYIGTLDRGFIFQICFHPTEESGNLDIARAPDISEEIQGATGAEFYRYRGWPEWLIELRMKGKV